MSLRQNELVWVRVRLEGECFWVNLRQDNKVSESKMAVSESNMAEFRMAAIMKLSQNEWVKFFMFKMADSNIAEFKMAVIIKLSENKMVKFFFVQNGWIQDGRMQDGCHHKVNQIELVWVRFRVEWECFWVQNSWIQDGRIQDGRIQNGCHHEVNEIEFWEKITRCLNPRWQCLNQTWQSSRWLPS